MRNKKRVRLLAYALNRNLEGSFALRIRFSAARYSFCSRSSWFTEPAGDGSECFASQALPDLGEGGALGIYVLFFLHLESRRVSVAGITRHPAQEWMEQIARSATQETWGYLDGCRYVLHDRDTKFCVVSVCAGGRRCKDFGTSRQKSESERLGGTLGSVRQGGVSVEVDSVRRRPAVPGPGRVPFVNVGAAATDTAQRSVRPIERAGIRLDLRVVVSDWDSMGTPQYG
jgi:hypothetical protein